MDYFLGNIAINVSELELNIIVNYMRQFNKKTIVPALNCSLNTNPNLNPNPKIIQDSTANTEQDLQWWGLKWMFSSNSNIKKIVYIFYLFMMQYNSKDSIKNPWE